MARPFTSTLYSWDEWKEAYVGEGFTDLDLYRDSGGGSHAWWLYTPAATKADHSDVTDGRAQICLFAQRRIYAILRDS